MGTAVSTTAAATAMVTAISTATTISAAHAMAGHCHMLRVAMKATMPRGALNTLVEHIRFEERKKLADAPAEPTEPLKVHFWGV